MLWQTTRYDLDLSQPKLMGIVNLTPDSFSDGGRLETVTAALAHCEQLIAHGADLLDIGAESTRPGATSITADEELARLMPVLREALCLGVPVSVDTCKAQVMHAALELGADIINDIWALRQPGSQQVVAQHPRCGVCLMHMHGQPKTMQHQPMEGEPVAAAQHFLQSVSQALLDLGVARERIAWDPGIGFGKTQQQNFALLARQAQLLSSGYPLLVGWSRKSALGAVTGLPVADRWAPSVAAALLALQRGAHIVRVHDVQATRAALAVWQAMKKEDNK